MTDVGPSKTTRIGIIGVGQIGKRHLQNYQDIEGVEVVAIADIDELEGQRVAAQYAIPNVYSDFRALLSRDDIEAVDICMHNNLHMPATVAALRAGKHVYCEKPMAGSYCDAEEMMRSAREANRNLSIQLTTVFSKETKAAKSIIDAGLLGRIYHARSAGFRRRGRPWVDGYGSSSFVQKAVSGGGALYDMGVYHIANMLFLLGNPEVLRISGQTYQETPMDPSRENSGGYNVEELGLGFVRLAGGVTLNIIEAWAIHLGGFGGSYVVGTQAGIQLDPFGFFRSVGDLNLDSTIDLASFDTRVHRLRGDAGAYDGPQNHWIAALRGQVELLPTAEIALTTMLISEGIYLSAQVGHEVTAEEVRAASRSTALKL